MLPLPSGALPLRIYLTMTIEHGSPIDNDPRAQEEFTVEKGTQELKQLLGEFSGEVLPEDKEIAELSRENFQSNTFRSAGYSTMPDRYGNTDRTLYTLSFADGSQTFVVTGKVSSGNPYEVGHAADGGIDLRRKHTVIYQYDGQETITERMPTGETNQYTGEYGKPDALLPHLRQRMGTSMKTERATKPQQ